MLTENRKNKRGGERRKDGECLKGGKRVIHHWICVMPSKVKLFELQTRAQESVRDQGVVVPRSGDWRTFRRFVFPDSPRIKALSRMTRNESWRDCNRKLGSLGGDVGHSYANNLRPAYRAQKKLRSNFKAFLSGSRYSKS